MSEDQREALYRLKREQIEQTRGDHWEGVARAAAHSIPPADFGSTQAIHIVAALLRDAYQQGIDQVAVAEFREKARENSERMRRDERLA